MINQDIMRSWPHNWYGFWKSDGYENDELPTLQSVFDLLWNPDDKDALITYLETSPVVLASTARTTCLSCPSEVAANSFQFDGVWLWPRSLSHYVRFHSVVLPDRFVQRIRDRSYTAPKEEGVSDVSVRDLPWPHSWAGMRDLEW